MTVYNHFPDESALLAACSAHWQALHPTPDLTTWQAVQDPAARLRLGLRQLYGWYRETDPMTANVLRDAQVLPALRSILEAGLLRYLTRPTRSSPSHLGPAGTAASRSTPPARRPRPPHLARPRLPRRRPGRRPRRQAH